MKAHLADRQQPTDQLVRFSEETIAQGSKSFALAASLFPPATRNDAMMLYAWCRYGDDVVDGQALGHEQQAGYREGQAERLERLEARTREALAGRPDGDPVFQALHHVVRNCEISDRFPLELIEGFRMDVRAREYDQLADTLDYGYHVAGVVGIMMAMIMGVRDEQILDRASDLGIAFQLTNIARDIFDDAGAGRVYLPAAWLREQGITAADLRNGRGREQVHAVALRLLDEADRYYESARVGYAALPWRAAWSIASAARIYRAIGLLIRSRGPDAWSRRIATTKPQKIGLASIGLVDAIRSRFAAKSGARRSDDMYVRPGSGERERPLVR